MGLSVNYFANLGVKCHFPKLECSKSSFLKRKGYQCNLLFYFKMNISLPKQMLMEANQASAKKKRELQNLNLILCLIRRKVEK